jgi:hypothetical protein
MWHDDSPKTWGALLLVVSALVLPSRSVWASAGYTGRDSGYAPAIGGAAVCRGANATSTLGQDVDNNGVNDRQVYIDLSNGTDNLACGLPGSPCKTIAYAMNGTNSNVIGGPIQPPVPNQIQAVCIQGTGYEVIKPTQSGASGTTLLPRSGHQQRSFNTPRYPFIIGGWDTSNTGSYPPYNTGDTAVIDCTAGGPSLAYGIDNSVKNVSNLEIAHLTFAHCGQVDQGNGADTPEGFMVACGQGASCSQIYVHDLQLTDIMKAEQNESFHEAFDLFTGVLTSFAVVNINATNLGGGYFARGAGSPATVVGPYRFQNISATVYGYTDTNGSCPGTVGGGVECTWGGFKLWDYLTGVEIVDNYFDLNPRAWNPHSGSGPLFGGAGSVFATAAYCVQDWVLRGNTVIDFKQFVNVTPWYGNTTQCFSRNIAGVVIDSNVFRNTWPNWSLGFWGIQLAAGGGTGAGAYTTLSDATITNNYISSSVGWESCIWASNGNPYAPDRGIVVIADNTCYGNITRWNHGAIIVGDPEGGTSPFPGQSYTIEGNIIAAPGAAELIHTTYSPSTKWLSDYNALDLTGGGDFTWNGGAKTNLASWSTNSGGDRHSRSCLPVFVDASTGNFDLASTDTCARYQGTNLGSYTTVDIHGTARPQGAEYDIGGFEQPLTCPCSIWTPSATPAGMAADSRAVEVGVKFQTTTAGAITGLRFYKYGQNRGVHVGHVWTATGTLLGTVTFANETAMGWQQANFASPITLLPNTTYIASYHTTSGYYGYTRGGLTSAVSLGPLAALSSNAAGGNGVYVYGAGTFPTQSYFASNYWVDVVFSNQK